MKYFTPELIVAYGSDDKATWSQAEAYWDDACERYTASLDSIKSGLPAGLRHVLESYYLHDSRIQGMGQRGDRFLLMLQVDWPPSPLLCFIYDLVEAPRVLRGLLPEECRSGGAEVYWQYDEIETVDTTPAWRQSILLSNGWEVTLRFRDVQVQEAEAMLPMPRNGAVGKADEVPQTA